MKNVVFSSLTVLIRIIPRRSRLLETLVRLIFCDLKIITDQLFTSFLSSFLIAPGLLLEGAVNLK